MAYDGDFGPFTSDEDSAAKILQGMISPAKAESLVLPPPNSPPASGPGQTTPITGSLAKAPSQATPARAREVPESLSSEQPGAVPPAGRRSLAALLQGAAQPETNQQGSAPVKAVAPPEAIAAGPEPTRETHDFSVSAWRKANPGGDAAAARKEAMRLGFRVMD